MKRLAVHLSMFFVLILFGAGCGPKPPVAGFPETPPLQEALERLRTRSESWQGYQARMTVRGESPKKNFSIQAVIVAALPDRLRFEAYKLGQSVGVLALSPVDSSLWIPSEQVVYRAPTGQELIDYFLGAAIPPEAFTRSLIAVLSSDQLQGLQPLPMESDWVLVSGRPGEDTVYAWTFTPGFVSMEKVTVRQGDHFYSVVYDPPVSLDPASLPGRITFLSGDWRLQVKIDQLVPAEVTPDSAFQLSIPEGTRLVNLDGSL